MIIIFLIWYGIESISKQLQLGLSGKPLASTRFAQGGSLGKVCLFHSFPCRSAPETQHLEDNYINILGNITVLSINHMRKLTKSMPVTAT